MFLVLALIYFLPTIIAICRKCNIGLTLLVNLFLGWTCIGWIVALVLALKGTESVRNQPTIVINNTNADGNAKIQQDVRNIAQDKYADKTEKSMRGASPLAVGIWSAILGIFGLAWIGTFDPTMGFIALLGLAGLGFEAWEWLKVKFNDSIEQAAQKKSQELKQQLNKKGAKND